MTGWRYVLDIGPWDGQLRGLLTFQDGSQTAVYAAERAQIIAKAQREIERLQTEARVEEVGETLYLDEFGEIVREPADWSRPGMSKFIVGAHSDGIYEALYKAGVFADKPSEVARVIIDLNVGQPARIYVAKFADSKLIDVILEAGVKLVEEDA